MYENNVLMIIDYWITEIKPKKKRQTFKDYLKSYFIKTDKILSGDIKDKYVGDILTVYNKMKNSLVKLSNKKKLDIILSMVETDYINVDTKEILNKLK